MASVAEQFVEVATMAVSNYSKKLANNVLKSNALFGKMYEKKKMVTGGKDLQFSIKYKENSGIQSFSGYDKLDITPQKQFAEAKYNWSFYNAPIVFSDEEIAKNSGAERQLDLIKSRIKAAEEDLRNKLNVDMYADGTGNDGKNMLGLAAIVATTPTSGILGGIDRAVDTFWRNKADTATGAWGSAATLYGRKDTDEMFTNIRVGRTMPDLYLLSKEAFRGLKAELETVERGESNFKERKSWGLIDISINGMDGVYDEVCTSGHAYMLNTDYLQLTVHSQYNFKPIPAQRPDDQAAFVQHIRVGLQLTTDRPASHGVISGITVA